MALLRSNAVVNTTRAGVATLTGVGVMIGVPGPKEAAPEGGVVRYVLLFAPGSSVQPKDLLYIQSWGANTVNPSEALRVLQANPAGGFGLEVVRCLVGEWIGG